MNPTRLAGIICLIVFACLSSSAQRVLTLDEAIAKALESNYDIQLVRTDSASYAIDNSYALAGFIPRVNGTAGRQWNTNNSDIEFSDGRKVERSGVRTNNLNAAVNLNWTLFDGLRMFATLRKLEEFTRLGAWAVKEQIVNTVSAVINNYFNIVRQKQQLRAVEEQMSISNERVQLADRKLSVGIGSKPELLQAKVDLNAQRAAQLTQQTLIAQLKEQLNQLMGEPAGTDYEVADTIPLNAGLQFDALRANLETTNPTLQVASKNIDIARLTLREARADLYPTLSFNSAYVFSKTENSTIINPNNPILFNQNQGFNYGFSIAVPLLNGLNTRRLMRQASLDIRFRELTYQNQLLQIETRLSNAYKDYLLQRNSLALEEENIQLARENVTIALARFRLGVSTFLELREAQISLEQAYNRLIAARYNTKVSETELLRLRGTLVY